MHAYLGHDERRPAPLILGHEGAGTVVGGPAGRQARDVNPLVTCGTCEACRSGRDNLCPTGRSSPCRRAKAPSPIRGDAGAQSGRGAGQASMHQAALAEPIACGWHAVRLARGPRRPGRCTTALVIGGGAIGLGAALSLKAQGSDVTLVEPNAIRRAISVLDCGLRRALRPDRWRAGSSICRRWRRLRRHPRGGQRRGPSRRRYPAYRSGRRVRGLDIRRMTLQEITFIGTYTYTARISATPAQGDVRRSPRRARLDRNPAAVRRRKRLRRHPQTGAVAAPEDHSQTRANLRRQFMSEIPAPSGP
jgi:hypothetical protein